jgi:hypothetical protein
VEAYEAASVCTNSVPGSLGEAGGWMSPQTSLAPSSDSLETRAAPMPVVPPAMIVSLVAKGLGSGSSGTGQDDDLVLEVPEVLDIYVHPRHGYGLGVLILVV